MTSLSSAPNVAEAPASASNSSCALVAFRRSTHLQAKTWGQSIAMQGNGMDVTRTQRAELFPFLKKRWNDSEGISHVPLHRGGLLTMAPDTFFSLDSRTGES
jgi:hypothetical protein